MLTARLAECVPQGRVLGVDASTGMLETARAHRRANLSFARLDVTEADFDDEFDVIFSNAALHWIKDHGNLLRRFHQALKVGGMLRVNFAADGNCQTWFRVARELLAGDFRDAFAGFEWPYFMPTIAAYERLLAESPFTSGQIWGENADRYFPDEQAMLDWLAQPAIVPFKQHLEPALAERFHQAVAGRLIEEAQQTDGTCFETFRRINVLARK